jgi:hypothetical protein
MYTVEQKTADIVSRLSSESQVLIYKLAMFLAKDEGLDVSGETADEDD